MSASDPHLAVPRDGAPLLSLAMIVRDGGRNLASLLAGAAPWTDEMVIGDTGSRDGSPATARRRGARVLDVPWTDDFAAARNAVLDRCRGRWILVLDADEDLAEQDWPALRAWVERADGAPRPEAGCLPTRNYQPEPSGRRGWTPVPSPDAHGLLAGAPTAGYVVTRKVRLFPNRPEIRFRGKLHETVEASLWEAHVGIADLPWPVHHFGYLTPDPAKVRRYLHLAHLKTTEQPHDPAAWGELAECALAAGEHRQARVAVDRALVLEPDDPDRRLTAGLLAVREDDLGPAEVHLAAVMAHADAPAHLVAEAAHLRAQVALRRGRPRDAVPLLAVALRLFPGNGHYQNTLGSLDLGLGRIEAARQAFLRAAASLPHAPEPLRNLALLLEAHGDHGGAAACRAEATRRVGAHDVPPSPDKQEAPADVTV